jgi:hypothetical protein
MDGLGADTARLLAAVQKLNLEEPDPNYWYAFGRIAGQ